MAVPQESLHAVDPLIAAALADEKARQQDQIELIASENIVSPAVREVLGHEITNKTLEGYPSARFHGGGRFVDVAERAAIDRAQELFGAAYANVQPHSGTQANQAVFFALLKPGDRVLSHDLAAGGHLSHGAKPNLSGRWFEAHQYGVDRDTGLLDYDAIAGLVAAGVHSSPVPHADVVTLTTTKTLRGPRGGVILSRREDLAKRLQSAVFPGVQGCLHPNVIAAKAVCFGEALSPAFRAYGARVLANARALAAALAAGGIRIVGGGTDTHMVLLDVSPQGLRGQEAEDRLAAANITSNRNPVPFDAVRPADWVGLRLGVAAATTRGFSVAEMTGLGDAIARVITAAGRGAADRQIEATRRLVARLCTDFPAG